MSKKTSYILIGIIVIIVIGLILLTQIGPKKPVTEVPSVSEEIVPEVQTEEEIKEIMNRVIQTQDISLCEKIKTEKDRTKCKRDGIIVKARAEGDPEICNALEEEHNRITCKDDLIYTQALRAKDSSLCEQLSTQARIDFCKEKVTGQ